MRRPAMLSRPRRGPDVVQERNERRRLQDRDALTCWVGWWACQDLNLGPHPYQVSRGWAPYSPAFSQLALIHEWHRDGVNHTHPHQLTIAVYLRAADGPGPRHRCATGYSEPSQAGCGW